MRINTMKTLIELVALTTISIKLFNCMYTYLLFNTLWQLNFDITKINNSISRIRRIYLNFNHCFLIYFNSDLSNPGYFFNDLLGPSELRYDKVWPIYIYIKVFVLKLLIIISCSDLMIYNWWLLEVMINICKQKNTMWIITFLHLFKSSDFSNDFLGPFELRDNKVWLYLYFV